MIRPQPHIAALNAYQLADLGPATSVSLAQNESAFPASPAALRAGAEALSHAALYPDPDWSALRGVLSDVHGVAPEHILCGAGSMDLISALMRCYAGPKDQVLGTDYGYLFAATAASQADARFVSVAEPEFTVSVDALIAALTAQTRLVFLCNPGNPTGTVIPAEEILRLHDALPSGVLLIVDQAYGEFSDAVSAPYPIFERVARGNICVLRTFSKAYALAGARVGWGVFPIEVAQTLRKVLLPNNLTAAAQAMACAAVLDAAHMADLVARTGQERDRFAERLRALGLCVPQSHTNFVLAVFDTDTQARDMDATLRNAGFIARRMGGYGLPFALRITIGTPDVMDAVAQVIERGLT